MSHDQSLDAELRAKVEELKTLRDEIHVGLHLAGMELRDEWRALERRLPDPSLTIERLKASAGGTWDRAVIELRAFRDRVRDGRREDPPQR